jgi:hypothetical protein
MSEEFGRIAGVMQSEITMLQRVIVSVAVPEFSGAAGSRLAQPKAR